MSRNIALDILKLSMAFMVVGLHAKFLGDFTSLGEYLTVNGVFRVAVPIFLLISGFYFFPVISMKNQAAWFKRVTILYLVWMTFYSYVWFSLPSFSFIDIAKLLHNIIMGYHHLWYVSGIIGAAIILLFTCRLPVPIFVFTIFLSFFIGVSIQYAGNYHLYQGSAIDTLFNYHWLHRNMLFFSYPFFAIGYLINKYSLHERISLKLACILSVLGLLLLFGESYINYHQELRDGGFDNFVFLLIVCPAIFILFLKVDISGRNKNIALYSSSIYFIHPFLLDLSRKYTELDNTALTVLVIFLSVLTSFFIIKLNKRFRFII